MLVTRLSLVVVLSCGSAFAQDARFADRQGRFAFAYPAQWTLRETPAGVVLSSADGTATFAVTPSSTPKEIALRDVADGYVTMVRNARPGLSVAVVEEGARRYGAMDGYRRVLRVGEAGAGAVSLETVFLRAPDIVLAVTASCPEAARATHATSFAAMLDSLTKPAAAVGDAAADLARMRKALDAALDAGILTAEEHGRKRAELDARAAALAPRPDPEVERKLKALDAARDAGVLDQAEYDRKRAELLGAAAPVTNQLARGGETPATNPLARGGETPVTNPLARGGETPVTNPLARGGETPVTNPLARGAPPATAATPQGEPPLPDGRKGQTYRHPIGFSFWRPDGWKVTEQEGFLQLEPPNAAVEADGPLELYFVIGDTVEGTGITRADDPRVVTYLDGQVKLIVSTLERSGAPTAIDTARGTGCIVDWKCKTPDGRDVLARCYVTIVQQHGVALLALGLPDKLAPRDADVRAMFVSFGFGEGEKDPALVGTWQLVATTSIRNDSPFETDWSRARSVGETQSRLTLAADGTYERTDNWHMIAIAGGVSVESKDQKVDRGRWCAGGGTVYLMSQEQTWNDYRYQVQPGPNGAQLRTTSGDRGQVWSRVK